MGKLLFATLGTLIVEFSMLTMATCDEKARNWVKSYTRSHPSTPVVRSENDVVGFGSWSNVQVSESVDPHASGMEIRLWKQKGHLVGYLDEYVGPTADPPIGKLENIQFDEKTGRISFSVKLSVGSTYSDQEKKWVPSKDLYLFEGIIKESLMMGTIEKKQIQDNGRVVSNKETIELKGRRGVDELWENKPYSEWVAFYGLLMKERGPKW